MSRVVTQPSQAEPVSGSARVGPPLAGSGLAGPLPYRAKITADDPQELANALDEINCLEAIAQEEGYPPPADALLEVAETQLRRLHQLVPAQYMVNSGEEGDVVIFACPVPKRTIMLVLYSDDAAFCSVITPDAEFRESCATVGKLTDEVLRQATNLVSRQPEQA